MQTHTDTTTTDPAELGRAAWRRAADPFPIQDAALVAVLPSGPGSREAYTQALQAWSVAYDAARDAGEPQTLQEAPAAVLTLTHSPAEGTQLHGTTRTDGAAAVLRAAGKDGGFQWRWYSVTDCWGVRGTRDHAVRPAVLEQTAAALRAAGFVVVVEQSTERRDVATVERERAERARRRTEGLAARAERLEGQSEAAWQASKDAVAGIPFGQPILVGHHSERRHRAALDRMERQGCKSMELAAEAKDAARRGQAAADTQAHREDPGTTQRRIERLEAQLRKVQRGQEPRPYQTPEQLAADREHYAPIQVELEEELAYWRAHLARLEEGGVKVWSRADFQKGDLVQHHGMWSPVRRVNAKSVTVPHWEPRLADDYTWTVSYDKVTGHKRPA